MNKDEPSMRLFVAIELPDEQKQALARLQAEMKAALEKRFGEGIRVRWTRPEGIHLTLKFLGETPVDRLEAAKRALAQAVASPPDLRLSIANVGSFADGRAPRVLIAGVEGDTRRLRELAERVETSMAAAGWPREKRSFHPHLTLARLPEDLPEPTRRAVAEAARVAAPAAAPPWLVRRVSLMRSRLGLDGARYDAIATFPA